MRVRKLWIVPLILAALAWVAANQLPGAETHNVAGGYTEACGDLPGMIGDDC
jgi:hypothetical protein